MLADSYLDYHYKVVTTVALLSHSVIPQNTKVGSVLQLNKYEASKQISTILL